MVRGIEDAAFEKFLTLSVKLQQTGPKRASRRNTPAVPVDHGKLGGQVQLKLKAQEQVQGLRCSSLALHPGAERALCAHVCVCVCVCVCMRAHACARVR